MNTFLQDVRYALRGLRAKPGFAFAAVLALSLGIGATSAIFSVINAVLLRPLPFQDADRLVKIDESHDAAGWAQVGSGNLTYANFNDLREALSHPNAALQTVAAARRWVFNLTEGGEPEQLAGAQVSQGFFEVLAVAPLYGRGFALEEDLPGGEPVIILGHGLWQRRFGADPEIIGRTVRVSDVSRRVIGVMPPGFAYPDDCQVWTPLVSTGALRGNRRAHLLQVIGRLQEQATVEQASAEVAAVATRIAEQHAGVDPDLALGAVGLQERIVAPIRPALVVLFGAVSLLLLIACANVANLQLVRAAGREKEMAIRAALGAGRWRLVRQTLTESLLLALAGGAGGLLLTLWGLDAMRGLDANTATAVNLPRLSEVSLDERVLLFALLVSLLTGILFGLASALRLSNSRLGEALKEGGRAAAPAVGNRLRGALVVSEVALSLILLVGAGLLINSFVRLANVAPGFESNNLLTMSLFLSPTKYAEGAQQSQTIAQILDNVRTVPGVRSASVVNVLPVRNVVATTFEVENRPSPNGEELDANIQVIDPDYLQTMGIRLLHGRGFTRQDAAGAPQVMLINETLARQQFAGEEPLGRRITMRDWGEPLSGEIVGVVADVKADGLERATRPMIYWHHPQFPQIFNTLVMRTEGDPMQVVAAVKHQVWAVDREQTIATIRTMEEWLADSLARRRFSMTLLAVFAGVALLLAAVGVYAVMAYAVTQQTHEIGVRLALGAQPGDVLRLVLRQGVKLTMTGVTLGLFGALALTRLLAEMLYGVSATDPWTFTGIALLLAVVALLACFVPARRATKVDPMVALRYE